MLYAIALPMALCNILGALTGTWLAVRKGAGFVRGLFLVLLRADRQAVGCVRRLTHTTWRCGSACSTQLRP